MDEPIVDTSVQDFLKTMKYVQSNPERFKPCAGLHPVSIMLSK